MTKAKKRKQQQSRKIMQAIDTIEKAAATAAKIYKGVERLIAAILTNRKKTK